MKQSINSIKIMMTELLTSLYLILEAITYLEKAIDSYCNDNRMSYVRSHHILYLFFFFAREEGD